MSLEFDLIKRCTCCEMSKTVYSGNITHNLNTMASKAGIYDCLWRPDEKGFEKAIQIIEILESGIEKLKSNPEYYKKFNASNGWGTYEHLLKFAEDALKNCILYPDSFIEVSI